MLDLELQLFTGDEEEQEQVQEVETPKEETTTQPFKAFSTEEDFSKFTQSISSKAKGELLKEIGGSNVNEIKDIMSKGKQYDEINTKYSEIETKFNEVKSVNGQLQEQLILTKFNIADDFKDEFLTLAKAKVNDEVSIDQASELVYEKLGKTFFKEGVKPTIKIGGDSSKVTETEQDVMQRLRKL